ncbi:hypothetical protein V3481_000080 [Fusarium oxysporum f. sp. vasinfectum]
MMAPPMQNVCIPMHLDAFVLSPKLCDASRQSKIAPYTQPNYTALRLKSNLLQHDILDHVDFHNTQPATRNSRTADIGSSPPNNLNLHRMGVHLQWSLPRCYRTAAATGRTTNSSKAGTTADPAQPTFRKIPNRWLITRHLKTPTNPPPGVNLFQSWVVESDVVRKIKEIPADEDLESGVSPFVSYAGGDPKAPKSSDPASNPNVLNEQTEVFLGRKFDLQNWPGTDPRNYLPGGLTVMSSSNPYFADNALHNANVLSIIDNFSYPRNTNDSNPRDDNFSYLSNATCDYFVIGWHSDPNDDPFNIKLDRLSTSNLSTRVSDLMMQLSPNEAGDAGKFKNLQDQTRCLVHGAIYDVSYDFNNLPAQSVAEDGANLFKPEAKSKIEPLSIGTTALDSILTFLDAHQHDSDQASPFGPGGASLAHQVVELSQLLYAAGDQYDSRVQAQDMIAQQNFSKTDGGSVWSYSKGAQSQGAQQPLTNSGQPNIPSKDEKTVLEQLNQKQLVLDIATRKLSWLQWSLFAEWFKYKSQFIPTVGRPAVLQAYADAVKPIKDSINGATNPDGTVVTGLKSFITSLNNDICDLKGKVDCKSSAREPYRLRSDPTLSIVGLDSGWPVDILDTLQVLLDEELLNDISTAKTIFGTLKNPVPQDNGLNVTAAKLLAECMASTNMGTTNGKTGTPKITGFQSWGNRNPFAPLFIEWEGLYYHIDKELWDVQLRPSPVGHPISRVRYVPGQALLTADGASQADFRTLNGRVMVLPQPTLNLETMVAQVLQNKSNVLPPDIDASALQQQIRKIKFLSAPLSGLTNHLVTRVQGAHVKPNVRVQGQNVIPLTAADATEIGIDVPTLALMEDQSALTPYGSLMEFALNDYPNNPFKPVTHGQMVLTKLNIIDKFGQAITMPDLNRRLVNQPKPPDAKIYPSLSDYLAPDIIEVDDGSGGKKKVLNTLFPTPDPVVEGSWPVSQFIQLTPAINQDARINGVFLTQDTIASNKYSAWREATDFENPIWGWLVVNYADNGLQFFLSDGTFYREIRKGGVNGTNVSAKWLPYAAPKGSLVPSDAGTYQLSKLLDQLSPEVDTDGTYLQAFFDMINGAIQNMPFPPSSYSAYANAIVGKPLALVNAGWSIELAQPPLEPQFDSISSRPDTWKGELERYGFKLKIGDAARNFDGVVGYFLSSNAAAPGSNGNIPDPQPVTEWDTLFTYFPPEGKSQKGVQGIYPDNYPVLNPYYLHPEPEKTANIVEAKNRKYLVTSLLVDPYTPIHGYSPTLPTKSLTLPDWAVKVAMDKMHAFFHLGPSLVTADVPLTYSEANAINPDKTPKNAVGLPVSGSKGTWTWLQPYAQDGFADDGTELPAEYATMGVNVDVGSVKFKPAPYTLLEGYLQLMGKLDNTGGK